MSQLALALITVTVFVDVTRPGFAVLTLGDHGGSVIREGNRYRVEDSRGDLVGRVRSYRAAGLLFARHHGHDMGTTGVEVQHEHRGR